MTGQLDKSLDDLISEKRSSRPRSTVHVPKADNRNREGRRSNNHQSQARGYQEERPAPRGGSNYWQHDDRAEERTHQQPARGPPPAGQRWQRGQQPSGSYRSRAADPIPIITTVDGWEEVAQEEPSRRSHRGGNFISDRVDRGGRGGGYGPQRRRGGVWDRLGPQNEYQENGHGRQKAYTEEKYDPVQEDAKPRKPAYYDQHDHRDDPRAMRLSRRFEPYSRGAGRRGRGRGRGGLTGGGLKWKHDLYEQAASAAPEGQVEEELQQEEQQEEGDAEMQE